MFKNVFFLFLFPLLISAQKIKNRKLITLVPSESKYAFDTLKKVNWEVNFNNSTGLINPTVDSTYIKSFYKNSRFTLSGEPALKFVIDIIVNRSEVTISKNEQNKYGLFGSSRTMAKANIIREGSVIFSQDIVLKDADVTNSFQANDISSRYHLHTKETDDLTNANLYVKADSNKFPKFLTTKKDGTKKLIGTTESKILKRQTYKLIKSAYRLFGEYYLGNKNFEFLKWYYVKDKSDTYTKLSESLDLYKKSKEDNIFSQFRELAYLKSIKKIKTNYEDFLEENPSVSEEIKGYVNLNLMNCFIALGEFEKAKKYYEKGKVTNDKYLQNEPKKVFENALYSPEQIAIFKTELAKFNDLDTGTASNTSYDKYDVFNLMYTIEYRMAMFKNDSDYPCADILKQQLSNAIDFFLKIDLANLDFFKSGTKTIITDFKKEIVKRYEGKSRDHTLFNKIGYLLTGDYTDDALKKEYGSTHKFYKKMMRMHHLYTLVTKLPKECATFYGQDYKNDLSLYKETALKTDAEFNSAAIDIIEVFENVDYNNLNFSQLSDNYMAKAFGKGIVLDFDKINPEFQNRIPIVTSSYAIVEIMNLLSDHQYNKLSDSEYKGVYDLLLQKREEFDVEYKNLPKLMNKWRNKVIPDGLKILDSKINILKIKQQDKVSGYSISDELRIKTGYKKVEILKNLGRLKALAIIAESNKLSEKTLSRYSLEILNKIKNQFSVSWKPYKPLKKTTLEKNKLIKQPIIGFAKIDIGNYIKRIDYLANHIQNFVKEDRVAAYEKIKNEAQ